MRIGDEHMGLMLSYKQDIYIIPSKALGALGRRSRKDVQAGGRDGVLWNAHEAPHLPEDI